MFVTKMMIKKTTTKNKGPLSLSLKMMIKTKQKKQRAPLSLWRQIQTLKVAQVHSSRLLHQFYHRRRRQQQQHQCKLQNKALTTSQNKKRINNSCKKNARSHYFRDEMGDTSCFLCGESFPDIKKLKFHLVRVFISFYNNDQRLFATFPFQPQNCPSSRQFWGRQGISHWN